MTAVDVDALDKLREAATPGPWLLSAAERSEPYPGLLGYGPAYELIVDYSSEDGTDDEASCRADAALIVAVVNALPDLIAAVRERDALRAAVESITERAERHGYNVDPDDLHAVLAALDPS